MRGGEIFEFAMQRTGMVFQGFEVAIGFIGLAVFPTSKVNAHQFIGQGAAGLVVLAFVTLLLLLIIALGPGFFLESATRIFVEGLPTELGTAVADMNDFGVATLNHHGCQAIELGHLAGLVEPIPVGAKGHQQTWRQRGPRARKAPKEGSVGMLIHRLFDFFVQASYGSVQRSEHACQSQDQMSSGHDEGRVSGQGFGLL